ncbi:MAG: deoxyribose-phosphate aldolase [Clostridia bacterium]|nr:deoxyribose-phosphate aldolase [Clostridia bacterium]
MDIREILSKVDHTLLRVDATLPEIKSLIDDAVKYGCASVCIPPSYVKDASEYADGKVKICTVIGFPNGYSTTAVKCFEAENAVKNGADEIDMVINVTMVKNGLFDEVLAEVRAVKAACGGKLLKVIIETCLLTEEEKVRLCSVVSESGADFIKTSTGFAGGGATADDVALMAAHVRDGLKIKAAGGISTIADAEEFIRLGADRLGTSRIVSIVKKEESNSTY